MKIGKSKHRRKIFKKMTDANKLSERFFKYKNNICPYDL